MRSKFSEDLRPGSSGPVNHSGHLAKGLSRPARSSPLWPRRLIILVPGGEGTRRESSIGPDDFIAASKIVRAVLRSAGSFLLHRAGS